MVVITSQFSGRCFTNQTWIATFFGIRHLTSDLCRIDEETKAVRIEKILRSWIVYVVRACERNHLKHNGNI